MKTAGTLKLEIIKPIDCSWDEAGGRMRALRRTLSPALCATQRDVWPALQDALDSIRGKTAKPTVVNDAFAGMRKIFKDNWKAELERAKAFDAGSGRKALEDSYFPVPDCIASETENHIKSRWTGEHLKDLLANRASVPSWTGGTAFFAEGRKCEVRGSADEARLTFPLWGTGKNATEFAVAPCGAGHRAIWDRMCDQDLSKERKELADERGEAQKSLKARENKLDKESVKLQRKIAGLDKKIEGLEAYKLGKVGITYDERKRKWYALVTWTQERPDTAAAGNAVAVCNFGVNCFIMVVDQRGRMVHRESGAQIVAVRKRFWHRRQELAQTASMPRVRDDGSPTKNRGQKRRFRPLTDLQDKEARFMETTNRQIAAALARKCSEHGVGTLYLEDLEGVREGFEKKTGGDAHPNVKRHVHSWAYYQFQQAIVRACDKVGVSVDKKPAHYVSQQCPECGLTSEENVKTVEIRDHDQYVRKDGKVFNAAPQRRTVFKCINPECGVKADGDLVACVNHLAHLGVRGATVRHVQSEARKQAMQGLEESVA